MRELGPEDILAKCANNDFVFAPDGRQCKMEELSVGFFQRIILWFKARKKGKSVKALLYEKKFGIPMEKGWRSGMKQMRVLLVSKNKKVEGNALNGLHKIEEKAQKILQKSKTLPTKGISVIDRWKADKQHFQAMVDIITLEALDGKKDTDEEKTTLTKCKERSHDPVALCAVGYCLEKGIAKREESSQKVLTEYKNYYDTANGKEGFHLASYRLGRMEEKKAKEKGPDDATKEEKMAEAIKHYNVAAKLGNVDAMVRLAQYYTDYSEERWGEEAEKWRKKAVETGDDRAQLIQAEHYYNNFGIPCEAEKMYLAAAGQDNVEAQLALGKLYAKGKMKPKSGACVPE